MQLKRVIFSVEISGVTYRFAERTMREIENLVTQETAAYDAKEYTKVKDIHYRFLLAALNDVGLSEMPVLNEDGTPKLDEAGKPVKEKRLLTTEDLKDTMGSAQFTTLYAAILGAQGIKLETKNLGESQPS